MREKISDEFDYARPGFTERWRGRLLGVFADTLSNEHGIDPKTLDLSPREPITPFWPDITAEQLAGLVEQSRNLDD